ncbi:MAG: phosphatase PAP2 family protein [Actinobacteria bacterium]|nr:phosphatase PAP2 family protein [Actinomycetota bacterium]
MNPEPPKEQHAGEGATQAAAATDNPGLDRRLFVAIRTRWHSQPLQTFLTALSISGNYGLLWLGLAFTLWIGGITNGRGMIVMIPLVVYSTLAFNFVIKSILRIERPALDEPGLEPLVGVPSSKSFPSSHAAMSFAAATIFVYFRPSLWPFFYSLAFLVSWSRVYVGVHFPSDVLAGMFVGLASGCGWTVYLHYL